MAVAETWPKSRWPKPKPDESHFIGSFGALTEAVAEIRWPCLTTVVYSDMNTHMSSCHV